MSVSLCEMPTRARVLELQTLAWTIFNNALRRAGFDRHQQLLTGTCRLVLADGWPEFEADMNKQPPEIHRMVLAQAIIANLESENPQLLCAVMTAIVNASNSQE